jgi:hypothetical protein
MKVLVKLQWSTWDDVCKIIGPFKNGTEGKYVDGLGNLSDSSVGKIGLFYNNNFEGWLIQEGDWIIKNDETGEISYMTDKVYNRLKKINSIGINI